MFGREARRARAALKAPPGPLRAYLTATPQRGDTTLDEARLLAIDLETTSLDASDGAILSAGWVAIDGLGIPLGTATHLLVRPPVEGVGHSAVFHGITDDESAGGLDEEEALALILGALSGRVLLAHHAHVEVSFLAAACRRAYGMAPAFVDVDTLELEHAAFTRAGTEPPPGSLRLSAARERHGLPAYEVHNALVDALACAELYLAQVSMLPSGTRLRSVLS